MILNTEIIKEGNEDTTREEIVTKEITPQLKAFKSIDQIISDLKTKESNPLLFNEQEMVLAKDFFNSHNYFSFSIYRKLLPRIEGKQYTFNECLKLYNFNTFIREYLTKFTGEIELMLRATLIEHVGAFYELKKKKYTTPNVEQNLYTFPTGELYLDNAVYRRESEDKILEAEEIKAKFLTKITESKSDAIKHYKRKNTGIPLWVIMEEITYGDAYYFAQALDTDLLNYWIDNAFDKSLRKFILGWFRCINFLRNDCAHYNRLYGRYFTVSTPKLLREDTEQAGINKGQNTTLFANMLTIKNVLSYHVSALQEWDGFIENLADEIQIHKDIVRIDRMGFPPNWEECLHSQSYNDQIKFDQLDSDTKPKVKITYK